MKDSLTIREVANGWIIYPGVCAVNEFTHIALTPDELANHVRKWAVATTIMVPEVTSKKPKSGESGS